MLLLNKLQTLISLSLFHHSLYIYKTACQASDLCAPEMHPSNERNIDLWIKSPSRTPLFVVVWRVVVVLVLPAPYNIEG